MDEQITHEIDLVGGAPDGKGGAHRHVVFGKRIACKDLMRIDSSPMAQDCTQYQVLILAEAIVSFGTINMPIPLKALLDLDLIDREDLSEAHNEFQRKSLGDRSAEIFSESKARLAFGFKVGELEYPVIEFGKRLSGRDEVEANRRGLKPGVARLCFLIGRQISKIRSDDGANEIDGPIELEMFEILDGADVGTLRGTAELWRQSFRFNRGQVSRDGNGADGAAAGNENRVERKPDSLAPAGAA